MSQNTNPKNVLLEMIDANLAAKFLSRQICLIVEPSTAFSSSVRACLQELGVPGNLIFVASKFAQAKQLLTEKQPTILISEYRVESWSGFELIELHEKMHEEPNRISFITSKSTANAVLAEAAEGQIDGYLMKPFSVDIFRRRLLEIIQQKAKPSPYRKIINAGKAARDAGNLDQALTLFQTAKPLVAKAALACYYVGDVWRRKGDLTQALQFFREGRALQPIHFKCVTAEFETLCELEKYEEAAMLIGTIRQNFPLTTHRLTRLFDIAAKAELFEELPMLFEAYRETEERDPSLLSVAETALLHGGTKMLLAKRIRDALAYFDIGLQIAGRRLDYLEKVISLLLEAEASKEAEVILSKALPGDVGTPAHHRLAFRVNQTTMTPEELLNKGRELIFAGHGSPEIFHVVVRAFAQAGKETMAETAIGKAVESFPELRSALYKVLEDHLPKHAS